MDAEGRAFQDDLHQNYCWGCGIANPRGLRIKSTWDGDQAVCVWQPAPEHMAGPRGVLNGGIIATIIDCHSICTVVADAYRAEGRRIGSAPLIWFVTAPWRSPTAARRRWTGPCASPRGSRNGRSARWW